MTINGTTEKTEIPVIVLSRVYSTGLSVIRSLGAAGYTVDLIASAKTEGKSELVSCSKYVRNHVEVVSEKVKKGDDTELLQAILDCRGKYDRNPVLVPTDDYTTSVIDINRDKLKDDFLMPYVDGGTAGELTHLMDKSSQREKAVKAGFPVADEWLVSLREDELSIPDDVIYPCFCKPSESIKGYKKEMKKCDSREELLTHLTELKERFSDREMLVQEYLEVDNVIEIEGVCFGQEIVAPAIIMSSAVGHHEKGVPVAGTLAPIEEMGDAAEKAIALLKEFNYYGMFDMDIFVVGGKLYFNELNLRSGGINYAYFDGGFNAPELFVKKLAGIDITEDELKVKRFGRTFFYEVVGWNDYFHHYLTREQIDEYIENADVQFIMNEDDPAPGEVFMKRTNDRIERRKPSLQKEIKQDFSKVPEKIEDRLVVVLSRNYSTGLAVIRSLGSVGYKVDLVASAIKEGRSMMAGCSKYVSDYSEAVSKKVKAGEDEELLEALLAYKGRYDYKPVLFPTDDYTASIMDLNRKALKKIFIMPTIIGGKEGCLTEHMNKTVQGELAKRVGLPTPKEWIVSLKDGVTIPDDMVYPCFCKPIESITGYKHEMARCEDREELRNHLNRLRRIFDNRSILVQEFLEIDNEIDFSGVCLDQKIILPAIVQKTNVAQYEKGVTLAGKIAPAEELGELYDKVIAMLKEFHYFGMFDMELNVVGDKVYFNEVNLRSGGPNYSYFMSGVNLPALFVNEAYGKGHEEADESVTEYGKSFVYEKVAWDDYIYGFFTKKELKECIAAADAGLLCVEDDPEPGKFFIKSVKEKRRKKNLRFVKRKIKNVLRVIKRLIFRLPQDKKKNRRNPDSPYPRVLVTGRNYSTNISIAKALGEAGYEVEVLRVFQRKPKYWKNPVKRYIKPEAYSKYVKAHYTCVSKRKSRRIFKYLVAIADPDRKMLLIPGDDLMAYVIDDYMDQLRDYYLLPNVDEQPGEVIRLMRKDLQKDLARKAGLPMLNSCRIKTENGEYTIPDTVNYPCFAKPNVSRNSSKKTMQKCESREELDEYLKILSENKDRDILVEDYVEIKREISLLGVSTKEAVNGPALFGDLEGGSEEHRGVALTGEILSCDEYSDLIEKLIAFVKLLNYNGLYDIDLVQTMDDKLYFVEVNMRFGASGYAFVKGGVNLPAMYADYMFDHKPIDTDCKVQNVGQTFVSEKVLIEEYYMGRLKKSDINRVMDSVDIHFIKSDDDPRPYKHFKKFYLPARLMRMYYSRRRKKELSELKED